MAVKQNVVCFCECVGMRGFQPDDFVPDRTGRPHPDVMHRPDSDSTDWDNYFG